MFRPGFTVWRKSRTHDGFGGHGHALQDTGQAVSGRLAPASAAEAQRAGQPEAETTHIFATTPGPDIRPDDEIRGGAVAVRVLAARHGSEGRRVQYLCGVAWPA